MSKILIIEDDAKISRFLSLELEHEGYKTTVEHDGREGLETALSKDFDLIVLDLMLPSLSGMEILRRLRITKDVPVIILTARDQVMDKVSGLDIGANDYMTKPFAIEELLARIRVHIKRKTEQSIYTWGKLVVDANTYIVKYDNHKIEVTKKEFDLLVYLLKNKGVLVSRGQILDAVWGFDFYGDTNVVDVYIRYLRIKIDEAFSVKMIQTVRGAGYIIKD
ncbi:MAG: response regulator transcription factor [Clostridia bacterium]|nr:response regulator transcription factor [Clostridia bacterium]MBP5592962.1 response regulator transcription factor [Clostridia bacterium]